MSNELSDYATLLKIKNALQLHRPLFPKRDFRSCMGSESRLLWRRYRHMPDDNIITPEIMSSLAVFGETQPPAGGKNREWLQTYETNHGALSEFWEAVHKIVLQSHRRSDLCEDDIDLHMVALEWWMSESYQDQLQKKRQEVLSHLRSRAAVNQGGLFAYPLLSADEPSTYRDLKRKNKVKTRGTPDQRNAHAEEDLEEDEEVQAEIIPVPKRALDILRFLYPVTNEERSSTVDWDIFVSSMQAAVFLVVNNGGSGFIFLKNGERIGFHRSHPVAKIDPIDLRIIGKRMYRWFRWTRETFTLASK